MTGPVNNVTTQSAALAPPGPSLPSASKPKSFIPPDYQIIPKAKSSRSRGKGPENWLPYYAGFSADFVSIILNLLSLDSTSLVFDPFAGSGTTNLACKCAGIPSIGLELNPVAYVVSNAKLTWDLDESEIMRQIEGLDPSKLGNSSAIQKAAFEKVPLNDSMEYLLNAGQRLIALDGNTRFFLLAAAIETLRILSDHDKRSNPTWPMLRPRSVTPRTTHQVLTQIAEDRLSQFDKYENNSECPSSVEYADASNYDPAFKADAIITSPPYLNRLDYIMNFSLENSYLVALGFPIATTMDELRRRMIGTVKVGDKTTPKSEWGRKCSQLLNAVKHHPSRAAESYYFKTLLQYFDRLYECIGMFHRALGTDGVCFMVVRSSYFKNLEIPLASIVREMATEVGFAEVSFVRQDSIRSHLGRMDPDQRKWVLDKSLVENVILMRR